MSRRHRFSHCILLLIFSLTAFAHPDDNEDISIISNTFEYNHQTGIATYIGDVYAKQGTRELWGDKMEVFREPSGEISQIIIYGHPAKHESITDPAKPKFSARANEIIYNRIQSYLTLKEDAFVEQAGDSYKAPLIEYDVANALVKSPETNEGRTTIILKPRADA